MRLLFAVVLALAACKPKVPAPTTASQFRFSPRPNRAAEIHWRAWDASVFADAQKSGKPILLSLAAIWCHWCHVLDETTLSDPQVIAGLNRDFVPVRVDADQHPDVERRYILGGWPTVAFLTAEGEILDGGTYVPPAAFLAMMARVRGGRVAPQRAELDGARPGAVDASIVEAVARAATGAFDLANGGFGNAPKFPLTDAIELLLDVGERELAQKALEGLSRLEDPVAGGFYRYATKADWTAPHYEKMLVGNAEIIDLYSRAFVEFREPRYRQIVSRTVAYVERTLFDAGTGALAASQDADEAYYALDAAGRAKRAAPYVDRTLLTDRAARMVRALAVAGQRLHEEHLRALATRAMGALSSLRDGDGFYAHARGVRGQLGDQAEAARALTALGRRDEAVRTLDAARALAAPTGGYYDAEAAPEGLLRTRTRPLDENAALALALLAAGRRDQAARTLSAFAGTYREEGIAAARYARAVEALLDEKSATGR